MLLFKNHMPQIPQNPTVASTLVKIAKSQDFILITDIRNEITVVHIIIITFEHKSY